MAYVRPVTVLTVLPLVMTKTLLVSVVSSILVPATQTLLEESAAMACRWLPTGMTVPRVGVAVPALVIG